METVAHNKLKSLAVSSLRQWGCHAVSTEVRCPIAKYRIDVAGYMDRPPPEASTPAPAATGTRRADPRTVIIECKQDRSDFLRDGKEKDALLRRREKLTRIRRSIEDHRIKAAEPHLCHTGSALFHEFDEWDYSDSKLPAYRSVLKALQRVDERLHGQTKFCMIAQYHLADYLYVAAPRGLIRLGELPPGWGLLECPDDWLAADDPGAGLFDGPRVFDVRRPAPLHQSKSMRRLRLLRNIAVSASYKAHPGAMPQQRAERAPHGRAGARS